MLLVALNLVPVDETTDHFEETGQGFTCCCAVADALHCHSSTSHWWNDKQYHQKTPGPPSLCKDILDHGVPDNVNSAYAESAHITLAKITSRNTQKRAISFTKQARPPLR